MSRIMDAFEMYRTLRFGVHRCTTGKERLPSGALYFAKSLVRRNRLRCSLLAWLLFRLARTDIKGWIVRVVVFRVQIFLYIAQRFAKPLEVYDLTFTQEFDGIAHIRVVD